MVKTIENNIILFFMKSVLFLVTLPHQLRPLLLPKASLPKGHTNLIANPKSKLSLS